MLQLQSAFGIFALLALAWLLSENRGAVDFGAAAKGLAVTLALAVAFILSPWMAKAVASLNAGVDSVASATRAGTSFVFGFLGGGAAPYEIANPAAQFIFAFQALPVVLVVSALTTLLFYWGILQPLIAGFSLLLNRTMGVSGPVGLSTAANIFLGMVEAPLFIRPYLNLLTRSELFMVMTGGMAGIAGTVFVLYASLLRPIIPDASAHLLVASVLGAPAALLIARLMVPETEESKALDAQVPRVADSSMDAIVRGTQSGLELYLSILASIIVLVALVWLCNATLGLFPDLLGGALSLQRILGWIMAPVAWLMGVPWGEAVAAGQLMGIKTVLNEMLAYLELAATPRDAMSERTRIIMTYALCGFANFASLGIMLTGLSAMAPARRADVISLGGKSLVAGTLTTCLLGAIAGALN
ncbi:MAG: nucleoside transporter C-terminal domain-containing protein [Beijerinckiaceae bacterium]|nr:nucleoside transporter C-terminal domain-containing protein [Beijerinckiaceae bacterium]